jgi:hypothetical protein
MCAHKVEENLYLPLPFSNLVAWVNDFNEVASDASNLRVTVAKRIPSCLSVILIIWKLKSVSTKPTFQFHC